jgi:hypothetical protein
MDVLRVSRAGFRPSGTDRAFCLRDRFEGSARGGREIPRGRADVRRGRAFRFGGRAGTLSRAVTEGATRGLTMPRWKSTIAAFVALSVLLAACGSSGGPLDRAALAKQATTLHGLAGEGAVMAAAAEKGHLLGPFRRVHARELSDEAALAAAALDAPLADGALREEQAQLRADAAAIQKAFITLAAASVDPGQARQAGDTFERSASTTEKLAEA